MATREGSEGLLDAFNRNLGENFPRAPLLYARSPPLPNSGRGWSKKLAQQD
jgi:hypothetical protein